MITVRFKIVVSPLMPRFLRPHQTASFVCRALACFLSIFSLAAAPAILKSDEVPVVFARSGQLATLTMADDHGLPGDRVTLSAHGQTWGNPAAVKDRTARILTPDVRVPTVFHLIPLGKTPSVLAELVAYPQGWFAWNTNKELSRYKEMQFAAAGAPGWLDSWLDAVEFPIEKLSSQTLQRGNWRLLEKPAALILGREAAGLGPAEAARLATDHRAGVLVLEADWLRRTTRLSDDTQVMPKQARGALADLQRQQWPSPPSFNRQIVPWPAIRNRLAWLDGAEYPRLEEIYSRQKDAQSLRIVLSYLPWQSQLGRSEIADELFLRILAETAKEAAGRHEIDGRWCLVYPPIQTIKRDARPVLYSAIKSAVEMGAGATSVATGPGELRGYLLDLRGDPPQRDDLFGEAGMLKKIEAGVDQHTPLLILGDNRQLDSWQWLELDREQHKSPRPGVLWISESSIPPSLACQLRVMDVLTQWGILLENISQEKNDACRDNEW